MRVTPVVVGQVVRVQIRIGLLVGGDPGQPQFLYQPILMRALRSLHSPFGLLAFKHF